MERERWRSEQRGGRTRASSRPNRWFSSMSAGCIRLHARQIVVMDNLQARYVRRSQDGHRGERLSASLRDHGIRLTSPPSKRRSPSSKPQGSEQEPEPKKLWDKRYSPSLQRRARMDGLGIAVIFFLNKKGRVNRVQSFDTPLLSFATVVACGLILPGSTRLRKNSTLSQDAMQRRICNDSL
jgi:hypothetical protein